MSLKYEELEAHFFGLGDDSPAAIQGFITGLLCGNAPDDSDLVAATGAVVGAATGGAVTGCCEAGTGAGFTAS